MSSLAHTIYTRVAPVSDDGDVSECSPYIRQAVERCKLPISVSYAFGVRWAIHTPAAIRFANKTMLAHLAYEDALKELTK